MKKAVKGELTIFFSLVFLLLLALVGAVVESASIHVAKNEKRADASRAVESIFAEYQKNLLERYGIFALEGSYESGQMSEERVLNRLSFYGAENMETEIIAIRYLTDNFGKEFYRQAIESQKQKMGVSEIENFLNKKSEWEEKEYLSKEYEKTEEETNEELQDILRAEEQELPEEQDWLEMLGTWKTETFLKLVLPKEFVISDKDMKDEILLSQRELKKGYGTLLEKTEKGGDAAFFNLYLLDKFGSAVEGKEQTFLQYELEYLLEGRMSDMENLEAVIGKLCGIRFGINYAYLLTNQTMQAEAEAFAGTISVVAAVPALEPVMKQAILLLWSYGEAMMDVRALMEGEKVALLKSQDTWKLSLENLLNITGEGLPDSHNSEESGMTYREYLQMMLLTKEKSGVYMRALDLIEQNISNVDGQNFLKLDACVTGLSFHMVCPMRRNVTYEFQTSYQYH